MIFKRIKLKLKSGLLSDMQSDTIFGSFCWRMKESLEEGRLAEFLEYFKNRKPVFTISNGFLSEDDDVFFPVPIRPAKYIPSERSKKQKIHDFLEYKKRKEINHVTLESFNNFLHNRNVKFTDRKIPKFEEDLRVSVEINRDTFSAKEGNLFSYAPKYLEKNIFINVFVKVIDESKFANFECKNILKETFELGFGKKKSSGYGEMEVVDFGEFDGFKEPPDSNAFIILGNYLPSGEDKIDDMYYDFHVKFGKLGEELSKSEKPFKKPIIFFKPGSVFKTEKKEEFYGRVTKAGEIIHLPDVIQNGIAFTLRIKI